jgi:hypothetical protein
MASHEMSCPRLTWLVPAIQSADAIKEWTERDPSNRDSLPRSAGPPSRAAILDVLFPLDGDSDILREGGVDEVLHALPSGETVNEALAMLMNATDQIVRHADKERAVSSAGKNVDVVAHAMTAGTCAAWIVGTSPAMTIWFCPLPDIRQKEPLALSSPGLSRRTSLPRRCRDEGRSLSADWAAHRSRHRVAIQRA